MSESTKVVFDCNVFLQALANPDGPAGRCVEMALSAQVSLYLSPIVLEEIRRVTSYPKLIAKFELSALSLCSIICRRPRSLFQQFLRCGTTIEIRMTHTTSILLSQQGRRSSSRVTGICLI